MWTLTLRSPSSEPREYRLKPGKTTLGRKPGNDIMIADESASRTHAEINCHDNVVILVDLDSTNGTFINRERLLKPHLLQPEDQIRIGEHVASLVQRDETVPADLIAAYSTTRPLTRELLLESVDQHAVLLYEVSSRLNTILDLPTALREVSALMRVAMGAEKCDVILAQYFNQFAELGFPTSVAKQAIEQRSVVIIPDLAARPDTVSGKSGLLLNVHSVLCVPVLLEQEVVALIYVYKTDPAARPFDRHDVQLAVAISHQAALTIQRAQLLDKARVLEQWAITDSLTGLHNRRQILMLAELEFQRARRYQNRHPLALLMVDIDNFKQVNDTRGHPEGDRVIEAVAARCRVGLRDIDLIGRYGGDEFVVLLIETELAGARRVAERLRRGVGETALDSNLGPLNVSISVGVATSGPDYQNLAALHSAADAALYAAKTAGKNCVEVSTSLRAEAGSGDSRVEAPLSTLAQAPTLSL
jgi:diguanylate cyclase (GGDEF)-like protein